MTTLLFMGDPQHQDTVRCRVYGQDEEDPRERFLHACAGYGAVDCPAYDEWVAALQARGWLPRKPHLVDNPDGPGKIGLWRLTEVGRREWAEVQKTRP